MKYNRSQIMKSAWEMFRASKKYVAEYQLTFAEALRKAWNMAKAAAKEAEEAGRLGLVRMHYSQYKNSWADHKTVEHSYDKRTKTIVVMTKVMRDGAVCIAC